MNETKEFSTAIIASISSGFLVCCFSDMHEAAEHLMGHPIWTHHFADKDLWRSMKAAIDAQCPGMPGEEWAITKENYLEKLALLEAEVGTAQTIRKGDGITAMLPTDGIPAHLKDKAIVIGVPKPKGTK